VVLTRALLTVSASTRTPLSEKVGTTLLVAQAQISLILLASLDVVSVGIVKVNMRD